MYEFRLTYIEQQWVFLLTGGNNYPEALQGILEVLQDKVGSHTTGVLHVRSQCCVDEVLCHSAK